MSCGIVCHIKLYLHNCLSLRQRTNYIYWRNKSVIAVVSIIRIVSGTFPTILNTMIFILLLNISTSNGGQISCRQNRILFESTFQWRLLFERIHHMGNTVIYHDKMSILDDMSEYKDSQTPSFANNYRTMTITGSYFNKNFK